MRPHNLPFVLLGMALLWFGWFGFDAGSALSAGDLAATAYDFSALRGGAASARPVGQAAPAPPVEAS